jgi:DNA-binding response OmpR family regulator
LVVEDERNVRELVGKTLRASGYQVLEAADSSEALLTCEYYQGQIHLMLSDMVMPGTAGRDLAHQLHGVRPEMRVLFMSGHPDNVSSGEPVITKPFTTDTLAARIREALDPVEPVKSILVVDDEPGVRRLLSGILADAGYAVRTAANGHEALGKIDREPFDLMITDLVMPEVEGMETIRTVRGSNPEVKIIAISGAFSGDFLRVAELLGANATLAKPFSADELLGTIRRVLKS